MLSYIIGTIMRSSGHENTSLVFDIIVKISISQYEIIVNISE